MVCWGIDVGAKALHGVALDATLRLVGNAEFKATDLDAVTERLAGAAVVAIDAPAALSTRPHHDDPAISPKFRAARCGEVALGRDHGYWVPFVSPTDRAAPWMQVGFALFATVRERVTDQVIEVYPHACFRELARGAQLPKKTTPAGIARRVELLRTAGLDPTDLELWSHHALDAAVAALTAVQRLAGTAVAAGCDPGDGRHHDGSTIWLPVPDS
jgi:predicted nuclease with RNAse H fold